MEPTPDIFGRTFQVRMKERLLRDPLHGLIAIDEYSQHGRLLVRLIDSVEMQRLRRIRQLGMASCAFHGAEHSRFTHSVGAFHLIRRLIDQLNRMYTIDSELAFFASVAALVHDVGHGPFSHVFERCFGVRHEAWTLRILHDERSEVHRILSDYSPRLPSIVESMLTGKAKPGYLASLVSSQLDADRLDYLLRDSLMTGVKYGIYDLDRLLHMLRISDEGDRIVVADGGLMPIEKYIQARYHMYRQVYLHKTVTAAEAMLMAVLQRARDLTAAGEPAGLEPGGVAARALGGPDALDLPDYLQLDDFEVLAAIKRWSRGGDPVLADLSSRLLSRRLLKTLDVDPAEPGFEERCERAAQIVREAGLDPKYCLLRVDSSDTPYAPYDPEAEPTREHIFIEDGRGGVADVASVSPTIRAFTQSRYTLTRLVFPAEHNGRALREAIVEIFQS